MTNKQIVILVVNESLRFGSEKDFIYINMDEKHKQVLFIGNIFKTIKEKISLFENVNEESYLYNRIVEAAKLALVNLQEGNGYGYYNAELILQINSLETCFKRKLKPIGVRVLSEDEIEKNKATKKMSSNENTKKENIYENRFVYDFYDNKNHVDEDLNGKKIQRSLLRKKQLIKSLREITFN